MSKLISRSLAFLFTLTLAGAASARRPPALVAAEERADSIYATCAESQAQPTAGYRDMLSRTASAKPTASAVAVASLPARKMGDHFVLVCSGGEIHQGSGYRGAPARIPNQPSGPEIASRPHLVGSR